MKFGARVSFRSGNANFCARPRKSRDYAGAHIVYAAPVCLSACPVRTADRLRIGRPVIPQIDAGIAEKGRLWIETSYGWAPGFYERACLFFLDTIRAKPIVI